jgi:hypothetical protein
MKRADWEHVKALESTAVLLNLDQMPIASVVQAAGVLAAVARREATTHVRISVYREDPDDAPTPINVDEYSVFEAFPLHLDVPGTIEHATTDAYPNFFRYHDDHVFFVKECTDQHWLAQLPREVRMLLERT